MATYKLDTKGTQYVFSGCSPHPVSREDRAQKINNDGLPVWDVQAMSKTEGDRNYSPMKVQIASKSNPADGLSELDRVDFDLLLLRTFSGDDGMGIYFTATGIRTAK